MKEWGGRMKIVFCSEVTGQTHFSVGNKLTAWLRRALPSYTTFPR